MSSKSLNINISSGTTAIGSVNQGDGSAVSGNAAITQDGVDSHFNIAEKSINSLGQEFEKDAEQIRAAISQLSVLKSEVQSGSKDTAKATGILKSIRDNFSWAYPAIKDFVKAVWPAILGAIDT